MANVGRKRKYTADEILVMITFIINGEKTVAQCSDIFNVSKSTLRHWIVEYEKYDTEIFKNRPRNNTYSKELKELAINDFLDGKGSLQSISLKYGIRSHSTLTNWIKKYDRLEVIEDYDPKGEVYMALTRKTTLNERIEIVNYCLENKCNYKNTAEKFDVSYSQVYLWVKKFNNDGVDGLEDSRGKRKKESDLTELEKLQRENEKLKRRLADKEMETTLIKKLKEIERRGYSRGSSKKKNT